MSFLGIVKLKQIIKNLLFIILPIRNIIIMESKPDFTDNTKLVFDKLIEEKVNNKYKIVWFVKDARKFKNIKIRNVKFLDINKKSKAFLKTYYKYTARIIIDSNDYVHKVREEQFRFYLCHGTPLKKADSYCEAVGDTDYMLEVGTFFKEANMQLYKKDKDTFLDIGYPRNDDLFTNLTIGDIFPEYKNKKIFVWLPTYRKHKENDERYKESQLKYGLPTINSTDDFEKLDNVLQQNKAILLIKLHPAQDKRVIESFKCNNIKIISDEQLTENNSNLYKLLAASDALITDYSSVYYDYLLTKKPIGLAITDIEEYKEKVGFVYDYYEVIKGEYLYNSAQLIDFIKNVVEGKDVKLEERMNCLKLYYSYKDNKSSERVYEIIKKHL